VDLVRGDRAARAAPRAAQARDLRQPHALAAGAGRARAGRPTALDHVAGLVEGFVELHGDRALGDDPALVGGLGRIDGAGVVVLAQQKGRDTKENIHRNFGMAHPSGYRKAMRMMDLADKFGLRWSR
jgi:acetyl-CoA carboxylase alpha subunit